MPSGAIKTDNVDKQPAASRTPLAKPINNVAFSSLPMNKQLERIYTCLIKQNKRFQSFESSQTKLQHEMIHLISTVQGITNPTTLSGTSDIVNFKITDFKKIAKMVPLKNKQMLDHMESFIKDSENFQKCVSIGTVCVLGT